MTIKSTDVNIQQLLYIRYHVKIQFNDRYQGDRDKDWNILKQSICLSKVRNEFIVNKLNEIISSNYSRPVIYNKIYDFITDVLNSIELC